MLCAWRMASRPGRAGARRPQRVGGKGSYLVSNAGRPQRRLRVRAIHRAQPDLSKLARALIELAQAQVEAEAQAEHETPRKKERP